MTACTNKARGAVVAALAGALALGAAPAVALATTGDVAVMAVEEWTGATVDTATDGQNGSVTADQVKAGVEFEFEQGSGACQYLVPTQLKTSNGNVKVDKAWLSYDVSAIIGDSDSSVSTSSPSVNGLQNNWSYYYMKDGAKVTFVLQGSALSAEQAEAYFSGDLYATNNTQDWNVNVVQGKYSVKVAKDAAHKAGPFGFEIVAPDATLDGAYVYFGNDSSDKEIVFDNSITLHDIRIADKDGNDIFGSGVASTPITIDTYMYADGDQIQIADYGKVLYAGTYYVNYHMTADPTQKGTIKFVVSALDLTKAELSFSDTETGPTSSSSFISGLKVNGKPVGALSSLLKVSDTDNPVYDAKGKHTVTVTVADTLTSDEKASISGTATVEYAVLDDDVASGSTVKYGDMTVGSALYVNLFKSERFDGSKVSLVSGDVTYGADDLEVTVDGDPTKEGIYDVTARIKPRQVNGEWVGGSKTFTLEVTGADLDADERLYFYLDGKLAGNGATVTYDGGDWLEKLEVVVKDADGNDIDPSNYDVKVTDASGKEVDEVVDAGDYKVQVTGKTFKFEATSGNTFALTVEALAPHAVSVKADVVAGSTSYLTYTGEEIQPTFVFTDVDGNVLDIPAEAYDVTFAKDGKSDVQVKETGLYGAYFETAVDVRNYDLDNLYTSFTVTEKGVFLDVPTNEWYSQAVYDAKALGYMNGDGNGYLFNPQRELTRAEAVCVLFNMAGGDSAYDNESVPGYNADDKVYETGFSDVAGNEFYAKAIAWAKATGVVNGYADGTFGVSRNVTSEEFACMLANFERAKGGDTTVDADEVLASYSDASSVSDWAKDSVAWAVESGVMGNSAELAPSGSILRMRVAAMVVNYQPEKLDDLVIKINPAQ